MSVHFLAQSVGVRGNGATLNDLGYNVSGTSSHLDF